MLKEKSLIGRTTALSDEKELVGIARHCVEVELRRQIVARIHLFQPGQRRELAVAQVGLGIGAPDTAAQCFFVVRVGPDAFALLRQYDGGARILTHRQHAAGGDVGILQ